MSEDGHEAERHVTRRCPRMADHSWPLALPVPCEDCYSVESIWRRIPWEADNRTPVRVLVFGSGQEAENRRPHGADAESLLESVTTRLVTGWSLHNADGGRIPGYWLHWSGPVEIMSHAQVHHFDAAFRAADIGREQADGS